MANAYILLGGGEGLVDLVSFRNLLKIFVLCYILMIFLKDGVLHLPLGHVIVSPPVNMVF